MDIRLKSLYDKRTGFVQQRQTMLDKVIGENRGLTDKERTEQVRLAGEIKKMDELIELAKESLGLPPSRGSLGAPIDDGLSTVEQGQTAGFLRTGYTTEHRNVAEFVRDCRFQTERRVMAMGVGATGGFLIPEQLFTEVLIADPEVSVISVKATTIPPYELAPDAATEIPTLDQSGAK